MTPAHREQIRRLKRFLDLQGYDEKTLSEQLGQTWPPAPGQAPAMLDKSSEITARNVLIRLFLLGIRVDAVTVTEFIPGEIYEYCLQAELLEQVDEHIQACVVIVPIEDLLFASDAFRLLGTSNANEFVLPASTHSANFLRYLTVRAPTSAALDLGCGCGIHALFAARHCKQVVATDVSEAAVRYTQFNAALNDIDNVECLQGSLFDPVENQTFDLIISNPPFVLSPSSTFVYRDNAMELDEFCRLLVDVAPRYLRDGGYLQLLCEWVELPGETLPERIASWVRGCDAWILRAAPVTPEQYVAMRSEDIRGDSVNAGSKDEWLDYLTQRQVRFIHPGMMMLRKRAANNWLHIQNLSGDVVRDAGDVVLDGIAAVDFLESCDDESLLEAVLGRATAITVEQGEDELRLTLDNAIRVDACIDRSVAALLQCFDNEMTVRDCIVQYKSMSASMTAPMNDSDALEFTAELLSIVRVFVSRGFLQAVDL